MKRLYAFVLLAVFTSLLTASEPLSLERLFSYPNIYGTEPSSAEWSPDGACLAFLWNDQGQRFKDLYVTEPAPGIVPRRITDARGFPPLAKENDTRTDEQRRLSKAYDRGVSQFAWSPDSRSVAFAFNGDLFLVSITGAASTPRTVIRSQSSESSIQYSPDGRLLSFIRSGNIWTFDLKSGEERQVTSMPSRAAVSSYPATSDIQEYEWSPDGSHIALMTWDTSALEDIMIPDYLPDRTEASPWKRSYTGKPVFETRVGIVPREGGLIRWLDCTGYFNNSETEYNRSFSWSPDSRRLLVNWSDRDYSTRRLIVFDRDPARPSATLYEETQKPFFWRLDALWSPDGKEILITSEKDGYRHIYAVGVDGGPARQLTRGAWDVLSMIVPPHGDRIISTSSERDSLERHIYSVPLAGGTPRLLTSRTGSYEPIVSTDGRRLAARFSSFLQPAELLLLGERDPKVEHTIVRPALPEFEEVLRLRAESFTFRNSADGVTLHGFMVKPSHFDPTRRYPAVLSCVYADIAKKRWSAYDLLDAYMAESMGYVIVHLDFRASSGHGRDFHYGYYQKMGIIDADEAVSAADYLRTLPYIDPKRIGIWGSSYGGFLTLMTLFTHPGAFQAGAAWKPVSDWRLYTDDYTAQRLGRPQDFPEVYRQTSPISHVDRLADPLLIVHGMQDDNVLFQDTVRLVQKLLEAGKDFDVMFYPKGDHGLMYWQENRLDLMRRTARFFELHLGRGPAPVRAGSPD